MSDQIKVTVAPGRTVTLDPHPSGITGLRPLTVYAGEKLTLSLAQADRLYREGRVLHPVTGKAKPAVQPDNRLLISDEDGRVITGPGEITLNPISGPKVPAFEAVPSPRLVDGRRGPPIAHIDVTSDPHALHGVAISADGQPWPNF